MSRSGRTSLPVGTLGALAPARWFPVCSVEHEGKAAARSVRCRVSKASYSDPLHSASLLAGVWWAPDTSFDIWAGGSSGSFHGVIRFQYGYRGMLRTIYSDLRSGDYQIPPCEFLRVEATRYTPAVDLFGEFPSEVDRTEMEIEGEIADGVAADFSPLTFTAVSRWGFDVDGDAAKVAAPPGAYAFEIYPYSATDAAGNRFETTGPASIRDFSGGVWLPPCSPLPLLEDHVAIEVVGAQAEPCKIVFFVR